MVILKELSKTYMSQDKAISALKKVNLTVNAKEIFGIAGRVKSGKTTLLQCIALLHRPDSGTVNLDNLELTTLAINELRLAQRKIGFVPQHFNLFPKRTIFNNIALPMELAGQTRLEIADNVRQLIALIGMSDYANKYPENIGKAQTRRVQLAMALANKPRLLLCDEITTGLDTKNTQAIISLLHKINTNTHTTIIFASKDLTAIKETCSRYGILEQGELVEQSTIVDLFTSPKSAAGRDLLKATIKNELPGSIRTHLLSKQLKDTNPLIRIVFTCEEPQETIITHIVHSYRLKLNIIQAHLENVQGKSFGIIVTEVIGSNSNFQKALEYLKQRGLKSEVIGYVTNFSTISA